MNIGKLALSVLSVMTILSLALSGCGPARSRAAGPGPEVVVERFYDWYLDYPGNVVTDQAYRSSEYLTEAFVDQVEEIIASFEQGGYDPFLCAQDMPGELVVDDDVVMSGAEATVLVHQIWNIGTEYEMERSVTVELQKVDGRWKIADIVCEGD